MEKIFEIAVYKRLYFVNEAFDDVDRYNGGFLCDSRTSDNQFIINGLIERHWGNHYLYVLSIFLRHLTWSTDIYYSTKLSVMGGRVE